MSKVSNPDKPGVSLEYLSELNTKFAACPKNRLAQNACSKQDFLELSLNKSLIECLDNVYNLRIPQEGKPVTNQKASGRCWIFALLNCMRLPIMKEFCIEEFELSENFLFFYDKLERAYYILQCYLKCARLSEPIDGRLMQHLLKCPVEDGGQWDMLVNLVEKYGVMPKSCWTETFSCEASRHMVDLLRSMIRGYAADIYSAVETGENDEQLQVRLDDMVKNIHKVLTICLGQPPNSFEWAYYSKNCNSKEDEDKEKGSSALGKEAVRTQAMCPLEFYHKFVKPHFDLSNYVCLVHDPRHPTSRVYTVDMLNNMNGARQVLYLNQSIDVLKRAAHAMLLDGKAVWFGCDVNKRHNRKTAISDPQLYDLEAIFDVDGMGGLNKAQRLKFGDSLMTHAMVFTGVDVTEGATTAYKKWRVENSWGDTYGDKGYQAMTDAWFDEYVFEVAVDRRYLSEDVLAVLEQDPYVLPAWDPMGALA